MGANTFMTMGAGKTAAEAFRAAVEQAQYENGHGGYTGTIAEKRSFTVIQLRSLQGLGTPELAAKAAREYASKLLDEGDGRIDDKWGPAGCIRVDAEKWLFFGWASS